MAIKTPNSTVVSVSDPGIPQSSSRATVPTRIPAILDENGNNTITTTSANPTVVNVGRGGSAATGTLNIAAAADRSVVIAGINTTETNIVTVDSVSVFNTDKEIFVTGVDQRTVQQFVYSDPLAPAGVGAQGQLGGVKVDGTSIIVDSNGVISSVVGGGGGSGGGVSTVSVVSANGFAGTVANPTTAPAITLQTTVTGLLKGNANGIVAAVSGTDYAPATSGSAILSGNGSGGFSSVTIGSGLTFIDGTLEATGGGGGGASTLSGLSDVALDEDLSNGQVLKYNSVTQKWENGTDNTGGGGGGTDTNTTYAISAETVTGTTVLRLTGSDASVDDVTFAAGANMTITRTDANTITFAASGGGDGGGGGSGTVTSVGLSTSLEGISITGSPITGSGTIAISGTLGVESGGTGAGTPESALVNLGAVAKSGDTMTGALTLSGAPTQGLHAATKAYVDNLANGLNIIPSCRTATSANLSATYANGTAGVGATLTGTGSLPQINAVTLTSGDRVLVKDQTTKTQNGVYQVTTVSPNWVLTRVEDFDNTPAGEIGSGDGVFIEQGTLTGTHWVQTTPAPITVGTSNIVFVQFGGPGSITAGTGISIQNNVVTNSGIVSISATAPVSASTSNGATSLSLGTVGIDKGGTGKTTAVEALLALSPLTTKGDLMVMKTASTPGLTVEHARLPMGTANSVLMVDTLASNPTGLKWASLSDVYAPKTTGTSILAGNNNGGFTNVTLSGLAYDSTTATLTNSTSVTLSAAAGTSPVSANISLGGTGANSSTKTVKLVQGSGVTLATDAGAGTITISASGGGSGTVTSVAFSTGTTGLSVSTGGTAPNLTNNPITGAGTFTLAGTLATANGGTGASTYAKGDILYASATNTLSKLGVGTENQVLTVGANSTLGWATPSSGGGGGSGGGIEMVVLRYDTNGTFVSGPNSGLITKTDGVSVTITNAVACVLSLSFTGKTTPPKSFTYYGQNATTNNWRITPVASQSSFLMTGTLTGGVPDLASMLFNSSNTISMTLPPATANASGTTPYVVIVIGF